MESYRSGFYENPTPQLSKNAFSKMISQENTLRMKLIKYETTYLNQNNALLSRYTFTSKIINIFIYG